jgi:hypothetical protein
MSEEVTAWWCGAYGCRTRIVGGEKEKLDHMRAEHPHHFGVIFLPDEAER